MSLWSQVLESVGRLAKDVARQQLRTLERRSTTARRRDRQNRQNRKAPRADRRTYPGDHTGPFTVVYAPHAGSLPDPGEVVWTWVPFEEDHRQGKDRPVLIVGREGDWLLAVPFSSQNHDLDADQEAGEGRYWVEVGTGPWDARGKDSYVRVNRVIRVDPRAVRRVGGKLDRHRFDKVAAALRARYGS